MKRRDFIDLPLAYEDGSRAVLSIAKGETGGQVFREAFQAWGAARGASAVAGPRGRVRGGGQHRQLQRILGNLALERLVERHQLVEIVLGSGPPSCMDTRALAKAAGLCQSPPRSEGCSVKELRRSNRHRAGRPNPSNLIRVMPAKGRERLLQSIRLPDLRIASRAEIRRCSPPPSARRGTAVR